MRRSQRRVHLILWMIILPLTIAGLALAFQGKRSVPTVPEGEGLAVPGRSR